MADERSIGCKKKTNQSECVQGPDGKDVAR